MTKQRAELVERYNDRLAKVYDNATHASADAWTSPRTIDDLLMCRLAPGARVLDLGIGTGQSSESLHAMGAQITGIDLSDEMLAISAQKFPVWELRKWDLNDGLPLLPGIYDAAVASGVLELVDDIRRIFSSVASVLKPSAPFAFTFEEYLPDHPPQDRAVSEWGGGTLDPLSEERSFLIYRRDLNEVAAALSRAGFTLVESKRFTSYYRNGVPVIYQVVMAERGQLALSR